LLLLHLHSTPARIAHFGDSTAFDNLGAGGAHMNWRRWLWHQYHGHTPGTQLSRSANFGNIPGGMDVHGSVIEPEPAKCPTVTCRRVIKMPCLPPRPQGQSVRTIGLFVMLNHRNDNAQTMGCTLTPLGFYYVLPAVAQGAAAKRRATMQGGSA